MNPSRKITLKPKSKNHSPNSVVKSIYVITGKDESLVNNCYHKLISNLLTPQERATALLDADPKKVTAAQVLDELRTVPLLSNKRVVLIRQADNFISENRETIESYFDSPCATGVFILTVKAWPTNTKLAKKLTKNGELITLKSPKTWQLPDRLHQYAMDAHGKTLPAQAAELLIEFAGDDISLLYSEIDKLATFADKEDQITVQHIESLTGHNRLFSAFNVIDACLSGNTAQAISRLRDMFAQDRDAQYTVVGAFAYHFRRMFTAKMLSEKGKSPDEIARILHIWTNEDALFRQIKKVSLEDIGSTIRKLADTDYKIKTGQSTPEVAMEQLVLQMG